MSHEDQNYIATLLSQNMADESAKTELQIELNKNKLDVINAKSDAIY